MVINLDTVKLLFLIVGNIRCQVVPWRIKQLTKEPFRYSLDKRNGIIDLQMDVENGDNVANVGMAYLDFIQWTRKVINEIEQSLREETKDGEKS